MPLGLGCSARPGRAKDNRTGSWRVFWPRFDHSKCSKCGMCQTLCPEGCISEDGEGTFQPDLTYCKGCGICAEECPGGAIQMEKEEK
ncbi:MAG: 4Fe-4S binding protein [Methanomicrobiales archaeon]|nr:4Fe-4S binding protein [Methanomicrobiales archaeon]